MAFTPYSLNAHLQKNVCEIVFDRRNLRDDSPPFRRMLATCAWPLLYSEEGRKILGFVPPKNLPAYFPPDKNLCLVWDIMCCWWRCIPVESVEIRRSIPVNEWWPYFDQYIRPMSPQQKVDFMKT